MTKRNDSGRTVVLASGSRARRAMLIAAGLHFEVEPASVDERAIRDRLQAGSSPTAPAGIAEALAIAKALAVSVTRRDAVVIGSDQVLEFEGRIYGKPGSRSAARDMLRRLAGKRHELHASVAVAVGEDVLWRDTATAQLHVRDFSDAFLERYLDEAGEAILHCAGAYEIEGRGVQLFERVNGDHFTILGMPLLPLLAQFRRMGVVAS